MAEVSNNDNKEDYEFIKEKIKEKPLNKRKLAFKVVISVFTGAIFGLAACTTFILCKPYLEDVLLGVEKETVIIPSNESDVSGEQEVADTEADDQSQANLDEPKVQQVYNVVQKVGIEVSDYEQLYGKLYSIVESVNPSVVTVTGVTNDTDWFNNTYENKGQTSGLVIANNGSEYLILAESSKILNVEEIRVTFFDDTVATANLKKCDPNTGLAVISVPMQSMQTSTLAIVKTATLGSSEYITQGSPVIAMGSPLGYLNSISYGVVTSSKNEARIPDWNIGILGTDIYGSSDGTGILINLNGEVIGFINQNIEGTEESEEHLLTFLGISDLKSIIQKLSNGLDIAYMGVKGMDVTESITEQYDVPVGAYVAEVALDSPAMYSGIQSGDVITKIGTCEIKTFHDLENELMKHNPNEETTVTVMRPEKDAYTKINLKLTFSSLK